MTEFNSTTKAVFFAAANVESRTVFITNEAKSAKM